MTDYFDKREVQGVGVRESALMEALASHVESVRNSSPYYQQLLGDVALGSVDDREKLATLPITRKSDLIDRQTQALPFAGMCPDNACIGRVFQSPGPINDPEGVTDDWWRMGRAFYAAGFRAGDVVQNCLSYHLTPGGFIMDSGARACGCVVIPAGPGQTAQQLELIQALQPQGYCGTPSFLKILLDKAREQNIDTACLRKALVSGEALFPALRSEFEQQGMTVLQAYATADVGLIAYETQADQGLIVAEDIIVEIVRPGTGDPVELGEVGEVVVTNFCADYPLIRFATGDLSATMTEPSSCGRTNMRLKGWLGRADQTTKVKGMFVHPQQVQRVVAAFAEVARARLQVHHVDNKDEMVLRCEVSPDQLDNSALIEQITIKVRDICKLSGRVELVANGELANDGIVIEDTRSAQ